MDACPSSCSINIIFKLHLSTSKENPLAPLTGELYVPFFAAALFITVFFQVEVKRVYEGRSVLRLTYSCVCLESTVIN